MEKKVLKKKGKLPGMDPKDYLRKGTLNRSPVVLMFQPTHFVPVPNERLAEWERLLAKRCGIRIPLRSRGIVKGETISGTRPDTVWDDCDWDGEAV
ncbi:MAG: hypothetical protein ACXW4I_10730 [Candidatus Deferrimicrobiaceae bacterium]